MQIKEITADKNKTLMEHIGMDVIFNRFDLRYNDYHLFRAGDICIPGHILGNTMKLGLYCRLIPDDVFASVIKHILDRFPAINSITLEHSLNKHRDLIPDFLYCIDLDRMREIRHMGSLAWLDAAKETTQKFQNDEGRYTVQQTEKPGRDDTTTETDLQEDDPPYKPRLRNMDVIQLRLRDKTEAMLLVSTTNGNVVFEHVAANPKMGGDHDLEFILCVEALLTFADNGKEKIFLSGLAAELKRRLHADTIKTFSGKIYRPTKLYRFTEKLTALPPAFAWRTGNIAARFIREKDRRKDFLASLAQKTDETYLLAKKDVRFDFYETKDDAGFSSDEYFNHETSKNYMPALLENFDIPKGKGFMDLGCGTGYVLYRMAGNFKKLYGVELEPRWVDIAKENFSKLGIKNYQIRIEDINTIEPEFFDKADVFYMFNPFVGKTMQGVADALAASFRRKKRTGHIIYINALCRHMFDEKEEFKVFKEFDFNDRNHVIYKA